MSANVSDLVRRRAASQPADVALVEAAGGATATWAELDARVDAVARGLSSHGLVAGRRVVIALPTSIAFVVTYLAAHRAGVVAVPLDPRASGERLRRVVEDSGARLVVAGGAGVETARAVRGGAGARLVVHGAPPETEESGWDALAATPGEGSPPSPADPETLATLLYTSGTAGRPRGVMLSHRALLANLEQVGALDPPAMTADDVVLGVVPLHHVYGLGCVLGQVLATGARLVLVDRFDADECLRLIAEHGVTNVPIAPPFVAAWLGRPGLREAFAGVRTLLSGALPLGAELAADLRDEAGVVVEQGYGLTEASPVVTATLASPGRDRETAPPPASVGHPLRGIELRVVEAGGRAAHRGDPGEIWVRGPNLFSGYWPDASGGPGADGWWATGDVGLLHDDGSLGLVDRTLERVLVSGFTVFPREVEEVLVALVEVAEVAVIGANDLDGEERLLAFVVPADGHPPEAVRAAVEARYRAMLPRYRWPSEVHLVDALPHSATGKVAKGRLRARLDDAMGLS